jgi:hypothetical protein
MGCGASTSSAVEYAQVAPGGGGRRGGMWRAISADEDDVVDAGLHVPTPVMDRMWAVHGQAMATPCMKEFMALLGIKTKDMQGGMRVFAKMTKEPGIPIRKLADMMRLPPGAAGQTSPVLVHFFNAVGSTSANGSPQGLTFRTFMFFHAVFKHAPLANAEKLRFWYDVMMLSNDPCANINESAPTTTAHRFLRDILCSKCSGVDSYLPRAPSKVRACWPVRRSGEHGRSRGSAPAMPPDSTKQ